MFQQFRQRLCKTINLTLVRGIQSSTSSKDLESQNTILVEKDDNITLIGINREKCRNALDSTTLKELNKALQEFENDYTSPVAVLYGIGGSFSTGYDVKEMESSDFWMRKENSIAQRHSNKPIVCGISGFCVGSGLEIALLCDLRVMEDTAIFGFFNRYLGVPMVDGGTTRLAQIVGSSLALDIITTGRRVSAKEALEIGLINRIVATGTALGQAVNIALSIAKFNQKAIQHDRTCIYNSVYEYRKFQEAIQEEIMLTSNDVLTEMKTNLRKFIEYKLNKDKDDTFLVKDKKIPDWEKLEIERERAKRKRNKLSNKSPS